MQGKSDGPERGAGGFRQALPERPDEWPVRMRRADGSCAAFLDEKQEVCVVHLGKRPPGAHRFKPDEKPENRQFGESPPAVGSLASFHQAFTILADFSR